MSVIELLGVNLWSLDSGESMIEIEGIGHSDANVVTFLESNSEAREIADQWPWLEVVEGRWGWSPPRFKWCSNHDSGWGCDDEGEWHRHYSTNYGGDERTLITRANQFWIASKGVRYIENPNIPTATSTENHE